MKLAYFITPHGFGHAARAAAVLQALEKLCAPEIHIYTSVPEWFFSDSVNRYTYHHVIPDVGLVQKDPMNEDPDATRRLLDTTLPWPEKLVSDLARKVQGCNFILCDIAPLGISVAKRAGIPSVLIENFTWDWIYRGYTEHFSSLNPHIRYLEALYTSADIHIQTTPVCLPASPDLTVPPVSRAVKTPRKQMREIFTLDNTIPVVLISMGGIRAEYPFLNRLTELSGIRFIIPGGGDTSMINKNIHILEHNSGLYHPDLINACDAVVFKAGYSTIAECYHAGIPGGYLLRESFPEMPALKRFLETAMPGMHIQNSDWYSGDWVSCVPELLEIPQIDRTEVNGADMIAEFLISRC